MKCLKLVAVLFMFISVPISGDSPRSLSQVAGFLFEGVAFDVAWFDHDLAVVGNMELSVLRFDGSSLTETANVDFHGIPYSVSWHPSGDFIAVGGWSSSQRTVRTFEFDGAALVELAGASVDTTSEVRWISWSPDGSYLAVAERDGGDGNELRILAFDGSVLTAIPAGTFDHGNLLFSVDWNPLGSHLAVGGEGFSGGVEVRVLAFDGVSLTHVDDFDLGGSVLTVDWHESGNFLGIAESNGEIGVASFDGSALTLEAAYDHGGGGGDFRWRHGGDYFAISGMPGSGGVDIRVLRFDPGSSSIVEIDDADHGTTVNAVGWTNSGQHLASGGFFIAPGIPEVRVWDTAAVPVELTGFVIE